MVMNRSTKEIQLLTLRQQMNDCLDRLKRRRVVSMRSYRKLLLDLRVCEELLREQRRKARR